jgi:hypothetical protein
MECNENYRRVMAACVRMVYGDDKNIIHHKKRIQMQNECI